jgi:hypothetical protein
MRKEEISFSKAIKISNPIKNFAIWKFQSWNSEKVKNSNFFSDINIICKRGNESFTIIRRVFKNE